LTIQLWDQDIVKYSDMIVGCTIDLSTKMDICHYVKDDVTGARNSLMLFPGDKNATQAFDRDNMCSCFLGKCCECPDFCGGAEEDLTLEEANELRRKHALEQASNLPPGQAGTPTMGEAAAITDEEAEDNQLLVVENATEDADGHAEIEAQIDARIQEEEDQAKAVARKGHGKNCCLRWYDDWVPWWLKCILSTCYCCDCQTTQNGQQMIQAMTEVSGLSDDITGLDSDWLPMHDPRTGELLGSCLMTIEIVPKRIGDERANAKGRSEPNLYPYLPPPTGRMHFSLNPFYVLYECCGPKLFFQAIFCCLCMLVILAYWFLKSSRIID